MNQQLHRLIFHFALLLHFSFNQACDCSFRNPNKSFMRSELEAPTTAVNNIYTSPFRMNEKKLIQAVLASNYFITFDYGNARSVW